MMENIWVFLQPILEAEQLWKKMESTLPWWRWSTLNIVWHFGISHVQQLIFYQNVDLKDFHTARAWLLL